MIEFANQHCQNCSPSEGLGLRAMGCKMYDSCLYEAAVKDWDSFNCESCNYENKTALEFVDLANIPDLIDQEIMLEDNQEVEAIDLFTESMPIFTWEEMPQNDHFAQ